MNKIFDFEDIRPYTDAEVVKQLHKLAESEAFLQLLKHYIPVCTQDQLVEGLLTCKGGTDFMERFFGTALAVMLDETCDYFSASGIETLDAQKGYLFLSNHRDILLDAALLQLILSCSHYPLTEISLGDNLMMTPEITNFAKINKMFVVHRSPERREAIYRFSQLSAYLRMKIREEGVSAWLAHKEGRSKNGCDETQASLIKMLLLSGEGSPWEKLKELNIVIQTNAYAYESCDLEKVYETLHYAKEGYKKTPLEDLEHIQRGYESKKGAIHIHLEPLDCNHFDRHLNTKELVQEVCNYIDQRMLNNYQLYYTNYIAYDALHHCETYAKHYSIEQREDFLAYLKGKAVQYPEQECLLYKGLLQLYAKPIERREALQLSVKPIVTQPFAYQVSAW